MNSTSASISAGGILQTPTALTTCKTRQPALHLGTGEAKKNSKGRFSLHFVFLMLRFAKVSKRNMLPMCRRYPIYLSGFAVSGVFKAKELWHVEAPALSSLVSQDAVLGLAEVCPHAQNRHKYATYIPTEHLKGRKTQHVRGAPRSTACTRLEGTLKTRL